MFGSVPVCKDPTITKGLILHLFIMLMQINIILSDFVRLLHKYHFCLTARDLEFKRGGLDPINGVINPNTLYSAGSD